MRVFDTVQIGAWVAYMVNEYLRDAPAEVRNAHIEVINEAAKAWWEKHGNDVHIVLDGSWPHGLVANELDGRSAHRLLMEAAASREVMNVIKERLKLLLAAEGHVVIEEE